MPGWAVGYAFAATTAGAWWVAGRGERGASAVTGATVVAQFALHGWFNLAQAFAAAPTSTGEMAVGHQAMDAMPMTSAAMGGWSTGMALAHILAAVLSGLWLWRGEAAAFQLARSLALFVFAPLHRAWRVHVAVSTPPAPARPASFHIPSRLPHQAALWHSVTRRGPPKPAICF
ncbi:hypothetical protein OIE61_43395 [Streptomyces sp. NBC_01762]|uniref:hypothetical protein n=1 Tax=unclassified Streptomyces TaxID=2593676 RepID=UPI002DDABE72|nr:MULTISPECIES: hypothetical protein [unclassified Streptomyces]WSC42713.1 hypothetical protein OIE61_01085 [Streptomyces sp. NBC_01762]WSC50142.1 hypothetical protein OIE61_43395 [Streptomyces sp. NBC_01762]WSJ48394.1 hypothetical protein OG243_01255 [Streptomyces sp. NBC_01318]WSJ55748.1 hypothetical protein OG243_43290 [Streptomyces sp. NBC_01318]